tara:strand:- start:723 stop:1523 length:801 start_codon:yes stop_codon:yes gene_type:complete
MLKPILKWAGGKTQLLPTLRKLYPSKFSKYYEPFLGGGAVFFDLNPKQYLISDSNPELINVYKMIATQNKLLLKKLKNMENTETFFYKIRSENFDNLSKVDAAARTIFLNRNCFNGLYRVNKQGHFNVPYARYKNPNFIQEERFEKAAMVLKSRSIKCMTFEKLKDLKITSDDFIFFDPPYIPLDGYADFKRYTKEQFHYDSQERLSELFRYFAAKGTKLVLTNSNAETVFKLYKGFDYSIVKSKRNINSQGNKRTGKDVIIYANI